MTEFIRKLFIDSRFRTKNSVSSSDFEIELPKTVNITKNALGWVSELHLPVSWYNIDSHNNRAYLITDCIYSGTTITQKAYMATLPPGNYSAESLSAELRLVLNVVTIQENTKFFVRYLANEGVLQIAYGIDCNFSGIYNRSNDPPAGATDATGRWQLSTRLPPRRKSH